MHAYYVSAIKNKFMMSLSSTISARLIYEIEIISGQNSYGTGGLYCRP